MTLKRRWKLIPLLALAAVTAAVAAVGASASSAAGTPIKIGVLSDCQGAFGSFDNQDLSGVDAAMVQLAGAKVKNPSVPRDGWTGASIDGHPLNLVGVGCSNDKADTAIKETKRLMEQLGADIMIGPLSGDESIAVANYAKQHPTKTFVNGSAGAQDTTLKVQAPNFFRFNGDGAQWNAGLGDLAYNKLHWKTAAVIADDYSFAWTSAAGFIADFCGAGGNVTKRVFPPLNTTDYSSYAQQLPTNVDGTFVAVGGAGLIPFLKAYEQAHGPIDGKKFMGNLFWGTPGEFQQLGNRVAGAYVGGSGTAGDLNTAAAKAWASFYAKTFKAIPPFGAPTGQQASVFTYSYYANTVGLLKGLMAVKGDISGGQKALQDAIGKVTWNAPYGPIKLDANRNAVTNVYYQQLYVGKDGKLAIKTVGEVPNVDQTFGGTFSHATPPPGRTFPPCTKKALPWQGKEITPPVIGG
ncbi:MAG: ABC transporter substrate-binding protein [Actinobacteria bacterium]|nr:ABC transporter substrate-binding protein [Actinomycetota bacterium]MBV8561914.1 ABC transporter substrate-binding protein [Actinomycetota bacterium]